MLEPSAPFRALDVERVRRALGASRFADVRYVRHTGSTNDDAIALLARDDVAGATLLAEEQSAGRGRRAGRAWIARAGSSLLFTTLLPEPVRTSDLWAVPFWVALGVADGLDLAGVPTTLRWPNDVFLDERKLAGILCVSRVTGTLAWVGCGVGINVVRPSDDALTDVQPAPAFASDRADVTRETLLVDTLLAFERRLSALSDPTSVARAYERRARLADTRYHVRLDRDGSELAGTARGLGPDGTLRLDVDGIEHRISLADARRL